MKNNPHRCSDTAFSPEAPKRIALHSFIVIPNLEDLPNTARSKSIPKIFTKIDTSQLDFFRENNAFVDLMNFIDSKKIC